MVTVKTMKNSELSKGNVQSKKRRNLKQNLRNRKKKKKEERGQRNGRYEPTKEFYRNKERMARKEGVISSTNNTKQ